MALKLLICLKSICGELFSFSNSFFLTVFHKSLLSSDLCVCHFIYDEYVKLPWVDRLSINFMATCYLELTFVNECDNNIREM